MRLIGDGFDAMKISSYGAKYLSIALVVSVAAFIVFLAHYTNTQAHEADLGALVVVIWGAWAWWRTDRDLAYERLHED